MLLSRHDAPWGHNTAVVPNDVSLGWGKVFQRVHTHRHKAMPKNRTLFLVLSRFSDPPEASILFGYILNFFNSFHHSI